MKRLLFVALAFAFTGFAFAAPPEPGGLPNGAATSTLQSSILSAIESPIPAGTNAIGSLYNPTTIISGKQTVTGSAVALPSAALINKVTLKTLSTNSAAIYIGPSGVTTSTGYPLTPGDSISIGVQNLNAIYIVGTPSDVLYYVGN